MDNVEILVELLPAVRTVLYAASFMMVLHGLSEIF